MVVCLCSMTIQYCTFDQEYSQVPYYNTPDFTPIWIQDKDSVDLLVPHTIGDFRFQDQEGRSISNQDVKGKIHVANFFFTTCSSICPKMTAQLYEVQKAFKQDTHLVLLSYSVTPWIDSVEVLHRYAERNHIQSDQWHLLTGDKTKLYDLARKGYFAEESLGFEKDSSDFLHTEHLVLVDQEGHIRGVYNGTLPLETSRLIEDIRLLRKEE